VVEFPVASTGLVSASRIACFDKKPASKLVSSKCDVGMKVKKDPDAIVKESKFPY